MHGYNCSSGRPIHRSAALEVASSETRSNVGNAGRSLLGRATSGVVTNPIYGRYHYTACAMSIEHRDDFVVPTGTLPSFSFTPFAEMPCSFYLMAVICFFGWRHLGGQRTDRCRPPVTGKLTIPS